MEEFGCTWSDVESDGEENVKPIMKNAKINGGKAIRRATTSRFVTPSTYHDLVKLAMVVTSENTKKNDTWRKELLWIG